MNFFDSIFKKYNDQVMKFSLEIGPQTDLSTVPPVNDVYITMLPGGDYKETAQQAVELVKKGFNPVPHFPARSMQDEKQLCLLYTSDAADE